MWRVSSLPDGADAPAGSRPGPAGVPDWTPEALGRLVDGLGQAHGGLAEMGTDRLVAAWRRAVDELRRPLPDTAAERLRDELAANTRLSRAGLDAGLDSVLDGVAADTAVGLLAQHRESKHAGPLAPGPRPALVILASNLPGLAVQSLLPALASRRPVLVKSPSSEPLFAPFFVDVLCRHEPSLRPALAATVWTGGRADLEAPLLAGVGRVVAFGGGAAMGDLRRRAGGKLIAQGPKISLAVVDSSASKDLPSLAAGLARDIALFDQRGCLSIQGILTDADDAAVELLARALASALAEIGRRWPPGPAEVGELAAVRQARDEAIMRGAGVVPASDSADLGGVLVDPPTDPGAELRPSPGRRWVRLHRVSDVGRVPKLLAAWRGRLQGVAVVGERARALESPLRQLGVSHVAAPGELQSPDIATWANGGVAPLDAFLG